MIAVCSGMFECERYNDLGELEEMTEVLEMVSCEAEMR